MGDKLDKFYTQTQLHQLAARKQICRECDQVTGVHQLTVGCKRCPTCSAINLLNGHCPDNKWAPRTGRRILLYNYHSPGDMVVTSAVVRDLAKGHPDKFQIGLSTHFPDFWLNNPHVVGIEHTTKVRKQGGKDFRYPAPKDKEVETIHCDVPLLGASNALPYHYIESMAKSLEAALNVPIPITRFHGDIHLGADEKKWMNQVEQEVGWEGPFWLVMAGGKTDLTCKWWNPTSYQKVVDHFVDRIQFVQCGSSSDWHTRMRNTIDLVGKTNIRQFIRLMYHASGVISPVSFAMHLAAAVPTKDGSFRPCVVIAGGREAPHWEAYPGHQFLHTVGMLDCCDRGGCWKNRCCKVGDGDDKDKEGLCALPVEINSRVSIPKCMTMITPEMVIRAIEGYLEKGKS
jgi:ADP-heptose:LPS heptosyltransferase